MADVAVLVVASVLAWATDARWPVLLFLAVPLLLSAIGLMLVWLTGGSQFIRAATLLRAPLYLAWKLPMYLGFLRRGVPKNWQRTERG